nr:unnamed protein product [Callosobruchus chinensis]
MQSREGQFDSSETRP